MNKYILFAKKILILLVIVAVFDLLIGFLLNYLYFRQKSGLFYRATYAMEDTKADVLVFGSSRANHHYVPAVFEKRFKLSFYNAGRDGNSILYHYAVLKAVLKRYTPKIVILDLNAKEFMIDQSSYDRLSSLFPYYNTHPEIRSIVELKSPFEKYKMYSGIYPYNSTLFTIVKGYLNINSTPDYKGYIPINKRLNDTIKTTRDSAVYAIDSCKVNIFSAFINECISHKVTLYIASSPYFIKSPEADYSIRVGEKIPAKLNIPFFDLSRDSLFLSNPQLFADPGHLNDDGAKLFSDILIDKIEKTAGTDVVKRD